ncbi:MAG: hypothetical protein U9Q68_05500 [Euryarchaeota archaeon]|nr:hypothetical protein [Euryarchaeota archaeon]
MADTKEIHQLEVPDLLFGLLFISGVVIGAFSNILEDCTFTPYEGWKRKRGIRIENHESLKSLVDGFWWFFNFFRVDMGVAKEINRGGRGEHRELLFSLCPLYSLWFFQNPFQKILKSLRFCLDWGIFKCCTMPFVNIGGI